jgi:hypothetical protein
MTTFDQREKEFETRFAHDQELQFKATARRNRLLGLWAAQKIGLTADAAEAYARELVDAELAGGVSKVIEKLCADLKANGQNYTPSQIRFQLNQFTARAKQQIMQE